MEEICNSDEYNDCCLKYDLAPIEENPKIIIYNISVVFTSTLQRSKDTAKQIFKRSYLTETHLLYEVTLSASFKKNISFPIWFWNLLGSILWLYNSKKPDNTIRRAEEFTEIIL